MSGEPGDNTFVRALREGAETIGVSLTEAQIDACARYTDHLLAYNAHTNLTRITEPAAVAIKHFVDSLTLLTACPNLAKDATVADVGTGAGFPGLVLKIIRPDLHVTLIDAVAKRLTFLREVIDALDLTGIALLHVRAEDAGRLPAHRDHYDLVTARAVAALPTLLEWCGPLVRSDGRFIAMKSGGIDEELERARPAADALRLHLEADHTRTLPPVPGDTEPATRRLIVYRKRGATPARYPRRPAEIKNKPLG